MVKWLNEASSSLVEEKKHQEMHLNVMLQNIDLIEGQNVLDVKRFGKVTVTTAHEAYSNFATRRELGVTVHTKCTTGPELYKCASYLARSRSLVVSHDIIH